ncbi:hypothetical protein LX97_02767 [Nonlabens dokdonensis]|jgi:hypothetical protein|uniref:Uncharacterized protein n=2 Tax=Nonlabens dokdonensis TaxID=328515 RepID=L7WHH8_NONDD|nr:hypothetical protein [Nonlabens dokdonensis]AGC78438.1 hypothetical protein DDD_3311 [Nonlabens dokdonensis DSW-6]PZX38186.1 hypothetical protein LX97_02767 [Nonlabens dokdonensis]
MISWQVYASNFQNLTRWKGCGYGMYTDSHGEYRAIVYRLKGTDSLLQVFPLKKEAYHKLSEDDQSLYFNSGKTLRVASFYPEWYEEDLKENPWVSIFLEQEGNLEIHRTDLDIDEKEARSVKVYSYE